MDRIALDTDRTPTGVTVTLPEALVASVLVTAKGVYQANLLAGLERWSGAGLAGAAKAWGGQYARSRRALVGRIDAAAREFGWTADTALVCVDRRWRRELVLTHVRTGLAVVW